MAKRKAALVPWPSNVWHTQGVSRWPGFVRSVRSQLANAERVGSVVSHREFDPRERLPGSDYWWGWDATWRTDDGARVRSRLMLQPNRQEIEKAAFDRAQAEENTTLQLGMMWSVTAQADQDWEDSWPTPPLKFLPAPSAPGWAVEPVAQSFALADCSAFGDFSGIAGGFSSLLQFLASSCPWYTVVFTHDRRTAATARLRPASQLVDLLPPSDFGRILEIRLHGDQDQWLNPLLEPFRVMLPWGGALILPQAPRKELWSSADYSIRQVAGKDGFERMLQKTALALGGYRSVPAHYSPVVRQFVDDLRDDWVLPELEVAAEHVIRAKEEAESDAEELREELRRTKDELAQEIRGRAEERQAAERKAAASEEALRVFRENPLLDELAETRQLADTALGDAEAAQMLLDGLTAEVGWLRGQLARVPGRSYGEQAPTPLDGPDSWKELMDMVDELMPHIRLGDLAAPLEKLRDHKYEQLWIKRTWACLEALEAYATAKQEVGPAELPHFTAYLRWSKATALIPTNLYCPSEANVQRNYPRLADTRMFDVPGLGPVFMREHFRIGGGRPPAPRMHVFDGTGDGSGLIDVGYIGPHLPNGRAV
ncbi:hypothetical protein [Streptomyces sp. NPDC054838]